MAQRAGLEKAGLIVKRRGARRAAETRGRVALQAEQVHVADLEHVRIRAAVDHVAAFAAVYFYRRVFVDKRTLLVGVACEADRVLCGGHLHLLGALGAVRIVAIGALDQAFVDAMVKRHGELGLFRKVAGVAKLGLSLDQPELRGLGVVL